MERVGHCYGDKRNAVRCKHRAGTFWRASGTQNVVDRIDRSVARQLQMRPTMPAQTSISLISSTLLSAVTGGFEGLVPVPGEPEFDEAIAAGMTPKQIAKLGQTIAEQIPVNDRATTAWFDALKLAKARQAQAQAQRAPKRR